MARETQTIDFTKLFPNHSNYSIIVLAAQECPRNERRMQMDQIKKYLGPEYFEVTCVEMWEMFTVAFIKVSDLKHLHGTPVVNYLTKGVMGVVGNKGGLLLSFQLFDKVFSFINVHLVSGANKLDSRCEMMSSILREITPAKEENKFECDATAQYNWIMGDTNFRFKCTFT